MDWSNFDENYAKLKDVLIDLIRNSENEGKLAIYENYLAYNDEMKIIVARIEEETQEHVKSLREMSGIIERGEELNAKFPDAFIKCHSIIRVDVKSFFYFHTNVH